MKLNLYRLRRMIMEELDSRRGRSRLNEAEGMTISVEQFLDEVAEELNKSIAARGTELSAQAQGSDEKPFNVSGVRARRGRFNDTLVGDDTACIIVGGSSGTNVVALDPRDTRAAYRHPRELHDDTRAAMAAVQARYPGYMITSQGGDYEVAEAEAGKPKKTRYENLRSNGEDSDPPVAGFGYDYTVFVVPTNLDNRLFGK